MNKDSIKFCPWEPCGVVLNPEDITESDGDWDGHIGTAFIINCKFCLGEYVIVEYKAPMSADDVEKKWMGIAPPKKKPHKWGGKKKEK